MFVGQTVYHGAFGFGILLGYDLSEDEVKDTVRVQWDNGDISSVYASSIRRIHRQPKRED